VTKLTKPDMEELERPTTPPERKVFAENLKRLRLERGLTQIQIAELSGIAREHSKSWGADGIGLGFGLTGRGWAGTEAGIAGEAGCEVAS